jgi:hypothetical protein
MFVGQIPIPINCSQQEELSNLCQQLLNTNNKDLEEKIDFIIYDMYHLDEKEKTYIIQNSI